MTREITHMKAFTAALESMGKPRFPSAKSRRRRASSTSSSTTRPGEGEDGEIDARGPWNQGGDWSSSKLPPSRLSAATGEDSKAASTIEQRHANEPEMLEQLLVEELRDLLSAEGQLVKALPKMAKPPTPASSSWPSNIISRRPRSRSND